MIIEAIIYLIAAIASLFVTGYAVHMFIGGLVSPETEQQIILLVCLGVAGVIGYMVWDVVQRRRDRK